MSTTDLASDVISYLAGQCQASAQLAALGKGCAVYDGPQPTSSAGAPEYALWIGHNPVQPDQRSAGAEQGFAFLDHARTKNEQGTVTCAAKHWSGDLTFAVHRAAVKQILAAVELMVRGDTSVAGPGDSTMGGLVQWSEFTTADWHQQLTGNGAEAVCVFEISFFARLWS